MPLAQVIQILKADCANIKDVNVIYDEKRPMDKKFELIVDLTQNGLRLRFEPLAQQLKVMIILMIIYAKYIFRCDKSSRPFHSALIELV